MKRMGESCFFKKLLNGKTEAIRIYWKIKGQGSEGNKKTGRNKA
jgi:hypothetical protein